MSTSPSAFATKKTSAGEEKQGARRRSAKGQRAETQPEGRAGGKTLIVAGVCEGEGAGRGRGCGMGIGDRRVGSAAPLERPIYSLICERGCAKPWQRSERRRHR